VGGEGRERDEEKSKTQFWHHVQLRRHDFYRSLNFERRVFFLPFLAVAASIVVSPLSSQVKQLLKLNRGEDCTELVAETQETKTSIDFHSQDFSRAQ
jgi:hypothetical protein